MKRTLSMLFAGILLFSAVSCSTPDDIITTNTADNSVLEETITETVTETEPNPAELLPDANYEGYSFKMLTKKSSDIVGQVSFDSDMISGEIINDTVFERNSNVETRYNITITNEEIGNPASVINKMVASGSDEYDILSDHAKTLIKAAIKGDYYNLNKITALDFTKSWWNSECADVLSIDGKLYLAFNSMSTHLLDRLGCIFFNGDMINDFSLQNPYELVRSGKWTMDVFNEMCKVVSADTDGDGKMTKSDRFGFIAGIGSFNVWINGANQPHVKYDENRNIILNYGTEKSITAAERIASIINADYSVYLNKNDWGTQVFFDGNALFSEGTLARFKELRDYSSNFGVVPCPKLSESQENYRTLVNNDSLGLAIPIVSADPERTGVILDAMGAYSVGTLDKAYYEITLKGKYTRDEDSIEMIDIINNTQIVDIGVMNEDAFGTVITSWLQAMRKSGAENMSSLAASNMEKFESVINNILEAYNTMN